LSFVPSWPLLVFFVGLTMIPAGQQIGSRPFQIWTVSCMIPGSDRFSYQIDGETNQNDMFVSQSPSTTFHVTPSTWWFHETKRVMRPSLCSWNLSTSTRSGVSSWLISESACISNCSRRIQYNTTCTDVSVWKVRQATCVREMEREEPCASLPTVYCSMFTCLGLFWFVLLNFNMC
jgi:hypothetical protein